MFTNCFGTCNFKTSSPIAVFLPNNGSPFSSITVTCLPATFTSDVNVRITVRGVVEPQAYRLFMSLLEVHLMCFFFKFSHRHFSMTIYRTRSRIYNHLHWNTSNRHCNFPSLQCSFNSKSIFVFLMDKTYSWFAKIFTFGFEHNNKMIFLMTLGTLLSPCRAPGISSKMSWFSTLEAFTTALNLSRFLAFTFTSGLSTSIFRNSIDSLFFKVQRMTLFKKPSAQIT